MRRLIRITFAITTLASAILCAATLALWVRTYYVVDDVWYSPRKGVSFTAVTRRASILLICSVLTGRTSNAFSDSLDRGPGHSLSSRPRPPGPDVSPYTPEGSPALLQWLGFDYLARDQARPAFGTTSFRRVILPLWFPTLMTALAPALAILRRIRRSRGTRDGLCTGCGYDLRATPDRCPECGWCTRSASCALLVPTRCRPSSSSPTSSSP